MLIEEVKSDLRIVTNAFDSEITELIDSAILDLKLAGIINSKLLTLDTATPDSLLVRAIKLYCKSNFGIGNTDMERYDKTYQSLKMHLCLSAEYTEVI
jgi:hypothetical protein